MSRERILLMFSSLSVANKTKFYAALGARGIWQDKDKKYDLDTEFEIGVGKEVFTLWKAGSDLDRILSAICSNSNMRAMLTGSCEE